MCHFTAKDKFSITFFKRFRSGRTTAGLSNIIRALQCENVWLTAQISHLQTIFSCFEEKANHLGVELTGFSLSYSARLNQLIAMGLC